MIAISILISMIVTSHHHHHHHHWTWTSITSSNVSRQSGISRVPTHLLRKKSRTFSGLSRTPKTFSPGCCSSSIPHLCY